MVPLFLNLLTALVKFLARLLPLFGRHLFPPLPVLLKFFPFRRGHIQEALDAVVNEFSLIGRHLGQCVMEVHQLCLGFDRQLVPLRVQTLLVHDRALGFGLGRIARRL